MCRPADVAVNLPASASARAMFGDITFPESLDPVGAAAEPPPPPPTGAALACSPPLELTPDPESGTGVRNESVTTDR